MFVMLKAPFNETNMGATRLPYFLTSYFLLLLALLDGGGNYWSSFTLLRFGLLVGALVVLPRVLLVPPALVQENVLVGGFEFGVYRHLIAPLVLLN